MNEKALGIVAGGVAAGLLAGGLAGYAITKHRKKSKKSKRTKASRSRSRSRNHKQKKPYTAGKRRDTSHRRIRYTKNNQPYIILKSGKARFIKKSSVRNSRNRRGGRY